MSAIKVNCENIEISNNNKICIIAGPCQYENLDMSLEIAETCRDVCIENSIDYVFKASFD